jgi:ribosomal protein L11 methyltransferase
MGCGTGILAILASRLGAKNITAVDIDDWAVENSSENIILNRSIGITTIKGDIDVVDRDSYDIILANITRNVLTEYMAPFSTLLSKDGILLISGFYIEDIEELAITAKKHGLRLLGNNNRNRWASAKFIKQTTST